MVGHSDVAPARKQDPGELFDWRRLAEAGIGLWPEPADGAPVEIPGMLADYGYAHQEPEVVAAFQRHFRPSRVDGLADEETACLLAGLLAIAD